jgi:hypothetical protein
MWREKCKSNNEQEKGGGRRRPSGDRQLDAEPWSKRKLTKQHDQRLMWNDDIDQWQEGRKEGMNAGGGNESMCE